MISSWLITELILLIVCGITLLVFQMLYGWKLIGGMEGKIMKFIIFGVLTPLVFFALSFLNGVLFYVQSDMKQRGVLFYGGVVTPGVITLTIVSLIAFRIIMIPREEKKKIRKEKEMYEKYTAWTKEIPFLKSGNKGDGVIEFKADTFQSPPQVKIVLGVSSEEEKAIVEQKAKKLPKNVWCVYRIV